MGNCIRRESATQWGGEDWDWPKEPEEERDFSGEVRRRDDSGKFGGAPVTATGGITEVKVKISKRKLEEVIRKMESEGALSARQVVAQLLRVVGDRYEAHRRPWRPALQSIPEVNRNLESVS